MYLAILQEFYKMFISYLVLDLFDSTDQLQNFANYLVFFMPFFYLYQHFT